MTGLPASIEAYLDEAGFSTTEILVLKRLLEGDAMTLRELASRTGKSTGVLDQATKKLLGKGILNKENINDGLKYTLGSLEAITGWVQRDMQEKKDNLHRKQQNFETFIASLKLDRNRPDMEYFDGEEGIKAAYFKLLSCGKEMLMYLPVQYKEEEDPLRDFKVEYFRERRKKKIFLRVIAHDNVLGKRYQSRDMFEYRKTILIPEDRCPLPFEQIICGDTVACFDHEAKKVCFIRYKEYAESERKFFEAVWEHPDKMPVSAVHQEEGEYEISRRTKTFSGLREFFLGRKSIATFVMLGVLSAAVTYGLYRHNAYLNLQRIREKVTSIAATGALQFDPDEVNELRVLEDVQKPVYSKIVSQLDEIRKQNDQIIYVYIIRPTGVKHIYDFVADADAPDPFAQVDTNKDGIIDDADQLGVPGLEYDVTGKDVLENGVPEKPQANSKSYTDTWGSFMTGYAPIKDDKGNIAGIIAVDMWASKIEEFTQRTFKPLYYFLGFFLFFVFVRFSAFNRSLFKELILLLKSRRLLYVIGATTIIAFVFTLGMYYYTSRLLIEQIGNRLMSIAATAASEIDPTDLEKLHFARDMRTEEYQRVFRKLNEIRDNNDDIEYVYILRPTGDSEIMEFVADADSNYYQVNENDFVWPGYAYDFSTSPEEFKEYAFVKPIADSEFTTDQWGTFLSGSAPIYYASGKVVAVLGVDMEVSDVKNSINAKFSRPLWFFILFLLLSFSAIFLQKRKKALG